jgi:hypothetical protein
MSGEEICRLAASRFLRVLRRIARALGVPVTELLG